MGKAKNLKQRVSSYFTSGKLGPKTTQLISNTKKIKTIETYSEINSLILEANLIKKHKPYYNIKLTDDKYFLYIKITYSEKYPKVLATRKLEDKNSIYFGPYPNANSVRLVLKTIRKIFPFQSVKNHPKKICFYNHLDLCPCPEVLGFKDYKRKNIKRIIAFLKGDSKKVLKDLTKEKSLLIKNEEFEKASKVQKQINAINLITSSDNKYFEYETNPNLSSDLKREELSTLKNVLNKNNYKLKKINTIECFDVSNTSGADNVGSMIVFEKGVEQKNRYRRFKIKSVKGKKQNDCLAIHELIRRRFMHREWEYPDLIVIDGGKGQVTSVLKALSSLKISIAVIGLAKKEEIIITKDLKIIRPKYDASYLMLLKRIRNEAHRFAHKYHRNLRSKSLLS